MGKLDGLAKEFSDRYKTLKPGAAGQAFKSFANARGLRSEEAAELQEMLVRRFGMTTLAQRIVFS